MNQQGNDVSEPAVDTLNQDTPAEGSTLDSIKENVASHIPSMDGMKEKVSDMKERVASQIPSVSDMKEKVAASIPSMDQAKEMLMEKTGQAKEMLRGKGTELAHRADQTINSLGERVHTLADKVREKAPGDGKLSRVADTLDTSAQYLQQHGLNDIQEDVTGLIRKYPMQSMGAGLVLGFLVGATLSRR